MKELRRFIRISEPPVIFIYLMLFVFLIFNLLVIIKSFLFLFVIDEIVIKMNFGILKDWLIVFLSTTISHIITGFYYDYFLEIFRNRIRFNLYSKIYNHIIHLPIDYFKKTNSGYLAGRIITDIEQLDNNLFENIFVFFGSIFTFLSACFVGFVISWQITTILLLFQPFYFLLILRFSRKTKELSSEFQENKANFTKSLQENFSGVYDIKTFNYEKRSLDKIKKILKRFSDSVQDFHIFSSFYSDTTGGILTLFISILFYGFGVYLIFKGLFTVGSFTAFSIIVPRITGPISGLANLNVSFQIVKVSIERIREFIDKEVEDLKTGDKIEDINEIRFEDVSFSYDDKTILKNINFSINRGEIIGIVGKTGAGKTTLINLILKIITPEKGKIYIGGKEIRSINTEILRKKIGIIPQNIFIFNLPLIENLKIGNPDANDEEVKNVISLVLLDDLIKKFPEGYSTLLGEKGFNLSGGEIVRIGIARAIIKKPDVIIIDEALSQVDSKTESIIWGSIREIFRDKIVIIIAHRLSTIKNCDKIILLKDGKIAGIGKHKELFEKSIDYQELYKEQVIT